MMTSCRNKAYKVIVTLILACITASVSIDARGRTRGIASKSGRQYSDLTILAIFAHPDDDVIVGPLLAHYAKSGVRVYLALVTSGQQGVNSFAKIPAGDQLGAVRESESRAACKAYGIPEPFLLREQDGTLSSMQRSNQIVQRLREIVLQVRPAVIITWGPDGITGHPDHRAVSNLVTELFQNWQTSANSFSPKKLYYAVFPQSKFSAQLKGFKSVNEFYVTTIIQAKDGLSAAAKAEYAYKSQHTPQDMRFWNDLMANISKGKIYLRLALSRSRMSNRRERDVFDDVP
ncbi:MAG TPA: PIG-L family deacetylase [Pyrinomonadaceae bacterium]|jgi:LmbE family N-acetylglucosaminyl deacetylase